MWTSRRSGGRRLGSLALACLALAGAGSLLCATAGAARAQAGSGGAYLGVLLQDLDQSLRDSYGYRGSGGVLVSQVESGSPAARAGLRRGDLLIRFAGSAATSAADLSQAVRDRQAGDRVSVTVWRDGRELALHLVLGARPIARNEQPGARAPEIENPEAEGPDAESPDMQAPDTENPDSESPEAPAPPRVMVRHGGSDEDLTIQLPRGDIERRVEILTAGPRLGVELQDLNPELGSYFDRPTGRGVLVTRVLDDTPARKAGVQAGDVIVELDGKEVGDASGLRRELSRKEAGEVRVTVLRRGARRVLTARLEEREQPSWSGDPGQRLFVRRLRSSAPQGMAPQMRQDMRRQMDQLRRDMDDLKREMESLREQMDKKAAGRR